MSINVSHDGAFATLTISNEERRNAISRADMADIANELTNLGADQNLRAIIITGSQTAFCAGADLSDFMTASSELNEQSAAKAMEVLTKLTTAITRSEIPVIAAVEGAVAGVGVTIASACDIVIAGDKSFYTLPFGRIALTPDGGASAIIAAAVGRIKAMTMALRQDRIPVDKAEAMGLVSDVVPAGTAYEAALATAKTFLGSPRATLAETKRLLNEAALPDLDDALAREAEVQAKLLLSPNFAEGVGSFLQNRAPNYR